MNSRRRLFLHWNHPQRAVARLVALVAISALGCSDERDFVVVYTALDREFSAPIFDRFTAATGVEVRAVYDTESTKSVGLANRIRAESRRPRCDVFWNNEPLNTVLLQRDGLLEPSQPTNGAAIPEAFRDQRGCWYGFAARARVLIVNTDRVDEDARPTSIDDLADPRWRGQVGVAKPLFGTTATHVAALFALWGEERTSAWLESLLANDARVESGNKGCARAVADGDLAFALTDTDDAIVEQEAGFPVVMIYPDSRGIGTLFLPNTVACVRGAPHPDAAGRLIDYLLSSEVEAALAAAPSAQIPLRRDATTAARVPGPDQTKAMRCDFDAVADVAETARRLVESRFLR